MKSQNLWGLTTEQMHGRGAIHVPLNFIVQTVDGKNPSIAAGVFQTAHGEALRYGSKMTHQLILGDAIIRPRVVAETNEMQGHGIGGIYRDGFLNTDAWLKNIIIGREELEAAVRRIRG